jgi:hypothetical protein
MSILCRFERPKPEQWPANGSPLKKVNRAATGNRVRRSPSGDSRIPWPLSGSSRPRERISPNVHRKSRTRRISPVAQNALLAWNRSRRSALRNSREGRGEAWRLTRRAKTAENVLRGRVRKTPLGRQGRRRFPAFCDGIALIADQAGRRFSANTGPREFRRARRKSW